MSAKDNLGAQFGTRERWSPGDRAHYEYHCYEGEDSCDADLWHRTHQQVTVLSGPHGDDSLDYSGMTSQQRQEEGMPYTYRVRFADKHEGDAWEDELLTHPRYFERPDYAAQKEAGE